MSTQLLIGIGALLIATVFGAFFVYFLLVPRRETQLRSLMGSTAEGGVTAMGRGGRRVLTDDDLEQVKAETKRRLSKKNQLTLEEKFFHAGIFSDDQRREFQRLRLLVPVFSTPIVAVVMGQVGFEFALIGVILGLLLGIQIPFSILDRRIKRRAEDIMFFLPLVIEQIAIGVSSSLDIGPCVQRVVQMADERDSHNVVTELLRHAQYYVKSGVSLEEALTEVGRLSGHNELKHSFMALAQVSRHGGEITRQLQELADAVAGQRETKIEAKIKKLELEATGPVALVFMGFLLILLIGFGIQIKDAFG